MDYLACDRATGRVRVPAANTGSVDVIDSPGDEVTRGDRIDNLGHLEPRHELHVGAGRVAKLTVVRLDPAGVLTSFATVPTAAGLATPPSMPRAKPRRGSLSVVWAGAD